MSPAAARGHGGLRRERGGWAFLPMFVSCSFAVHGVAYAALSGVASPFAAPVPPVVEVELAVVVPEPAIAIAPAPAEVNPAPPTQRWVSKPRPGAAPAPAAAPVTSAEAPPPLSTLGVSADDGLAVAGQQGSGSVGPGSLTGNPEGVLGGTGGSPVAVSAPAIDLRKLTSEWASRVSLAIGTRAVHEYPRSALRAHVEGTVLLTVRVGTAGQIEAVDLARSSGFPQLDEAALAAARELGAVPAPPAALHRYLRPFPVPVSYVIRG